MEEPYYDEEVIRKQAKAEYLEAAFGEVASEPPPPKWRTITPFKSPPPIPKAYAELLGKKMVSIIMAEIISRNLKK